MIITRSTLAAAIKEAREEEAYTESRNKYYARHFAGYDDNGAYAPRTRQEQNTHARKAAILKTVPDYAWPGGYAMAFYPVDSWGSTVGDVLCADCAREYVNDDKEARMIAECTDNYEGDDNNDHLYCGDCNGVICEAWQRDEEEAS